MRRLRRLARSLWAGAGFTDVAVAGDGEAVAFNFLEPLGLPTFFDVVKGAKSTEDAGFEPKVGAGGAFALAALVARRRTSDALLGAVLERTDMAGALNDGGTKSALVTYLIKFTWNTNLRRRRLRAAIQLKSTP